MIPQIAIETVNAEFIDAMNDIYYIWSIRPNGLFNNIIFSVLMVFRVKLALFVFQRSLN